MYSKPLLSILNVNKNSSVLNYNDCFNFKISIQKDKIEKGIIYNNKAINWKMCILVVMDIGSRELFPHIHMKCNCSIKYQPYVLSYFCGRSACSISVFSVYCFPRRRFNTFFMTLKNPRLIEFLRALSFTPSHLFWTHFFISL